jgi:WhiB family redox-sensing transcriptional regulator
MINWDDAACNGQETSIFFDHEDSRGEKRAVLLNAARSICSDCSIQSGCLDFAVRSGQQFGVWGGLTAAERSELVVVTTRRPSFSAVRHRAAS